MKNKILNNVEKLYGIRINKFIELYVVIKRDNYTLIFIITLINRLLLKIM